MHHSETRSEQEVADTELANWSPENPAQGKHDSSLLVSATPPWNKTQMLWGLSTAIAFSHFTEKINKPVSLLSPVYFLTEESPNNC